MLRHPCSNSAAPSAPPTFLNHSQLTAFSVHLEWIPPPSEYWNGIIRQYVLIRTELETGTNVVTQSLPQAEHTVGNLHPFYNYNFSVCAVTVLQGPCSDAYTVKTLEHSEQFYSYLVNFNITNYYHQMYWYACIIIKIPTFFLSFLQFLLLLHRMFKLLHSVQLLSHWLGSLHQWTDRTE